jgi:DMSO/TMAO reductase YedYZ molybdopterin-dependent catalytic subunit
VIFLMAERFQKILQLNKVLSLLLTEITLVMLGTGYAMTFIGVNIPALRIIHFLFDILFAPTFIAHTIINTFIIKFPWRPILVSLWLGKADTTIKLRVVQRLSSFGIFLSGSLQIVSGLDWFKLGLSRLLPYPLHREIDLAIFLFLIIHLSIAYHFHLRRIRAQEEQPRSVNLERRNAIRIMGGAVMAFFLALFLDSAPKIGTSTTGTPGELPPGQTEIERLKVLHTGIGIPPWDPETWRFEVSGNVENPFSLSWEEFKTLPSVILNADFHCVTGWTKFDNKWDGVSFNHIVELAQLQSNARFATIECFRGYSTSLPVVDLARDNVLFAYRLDDRELPREHGGPLRLVVPHKYGYKSAKWVFRVKFTEFQELGYWEQRGYSNTANPFTNDRYS